MSIRFSPETFRYVALNREPYNETDKWCVVNAISLEFCLDELLRQEDITYLVNLGAVKRGRMAAPFKDRKGSGTLARVSFDWFYSSDSAGRMAVGKKRKSALATRRGRFGVANSKLFLGFIP